MPPRRKGKGGARRSRRAAPPPAVQGLFEGEVDPLDFLANLADQSRHSTEGETAKTDWLGFDIAVAAARRDGGAITPNQMGVLVRTERPPPTAVVQAARAAAAAARAESAAPRASAGAVSSPAPAQPSLLTAAQRAKVPDERFFMVFDRADNLMGPAYHWVGSWQPGAGGEYVRGLVTFSSHFQVPEPPGYVRSQPAHKESMLAALEGVYGPIISREPPYPCTVMKVNLSQVDGKPHPSIPGEFGLTQFIFGADQQAWLWLEAEDKMGPRPSSAVLGVPNDANAARLRRMLAATPWWVALHAHSPRLIREFCPFAVALLLDRADWLTEEEAGARQALNEIVRECSTKREWCAERGAVPFGISDQEPGLFPLLKAALFVPSCSFCQDIFCADGTAATTTTACRAAALASATRYWAAESPPQSLPNVVYEASRQWADTVTTAPGSGRLPKHRGSGSSQTAVLLGLVTQLASSGGGAETLFAVMHAMAHKRMVLRVASVDEPRAIVRFTAQIMRASERTRWSSVSEGDVVWDMPEDWAVTVPADLGLAAVQRRNPSAEGGAPDGLVDASNMSLKEVKAYLKARGVSYGDCVSKHDFRALVNSTLENSIDAPDFEPCNPELFAAVQSGDARAAERILRRMLAERPADAAPFASGVEAAAYFEGESNGLTLPRSNYLSLAAQLARTEVIEVLCDVGGYRASEPQGCPGGADGGINMVSVLLVAALSSSVSTMRALIERGAPCDSVDPLDNCAAIHNALLNDKNGSHVGVVRELLTNPRSAAAAKASLALLQKPLGLNALFKVASQNHLEMLELLLAHGATIPETPVGPEHPLHTWGECEPAMIVATRASLRDTAYGLLYAFWSNKMQQQINEEIPGRFTPKDLVAARHQARVIDLMLRRCPPTSTYMRSIIESLPRPRSDDGSVATGSQVCAVCSGPGKTKCGGCQQVRYCGKECQKKHWKAHKKDCKKKT